MNPYQMQIDFTPRVAAGKKTARLTLTCSDSLKTFVDTICNVTGENASELLHRYTLQGLKDDIGRIFMAEPHIDKKLSELLHKKI